MKLANVTGDVPLRVHEPSICQKTYTKNAHALESFVVQKLLITLYPMTK